MGCVDNAPSYLNRGWSDDPVVPAWKLRRWTGNTNLLLLMNNYTFACSGRLTTWYLWWRVNNAAESCEVDFTLYVLRPPSEHTDCGTTVVGSYHLVRGFLASEGSRISRRPEVLEVTGEEVFVQPGDYVALHMGIGVSCTFYTEVWLRGIQSSNTVSLRRDVQPISTDFGCEVKQFTHLDQGVGFISAFVGEKSHMNFLFPLV